MNPVIRWLLLFFIILIPLVVNLSLYYFGNNHFDVPIYHKENSSESLHCQNKIIFPYIVSSDSIIEIANRLTIIDVRFPDSKDNFINNQIRRLMDININLNIHTVSSSRLDLRWNTSTLGISKLHNFSACKLLYDVNFSFLVLIDKLGRIRGYYRSDEENQFDRIFAEIEILDKFEIDEK